MKNIFFALIIGISSTSFAKETKVSVDRKPSSNSDGSFERLFQCQGSDANMEIYGPEDELTTNFGGKALGYYAMDLSGIGKGKSLEPIALSFSDDRKFLIITQITRDLPPTRIPVGGGVVNFDNRFGTKANCKR